MRDIAVVILNYNGAQYLREFLPKVLKYSSGCEIVVADSGSVDDSLEVLKEHFPQVTALPLGGNYGFCGGYNVALKKVKATYYVILNSDVEVTPGWIDPVMNLFENDLRIAAVQPKMLTYNDRQRFEYAGAAGGWIDALCYPFCRGRIFDVMEEDTGQYDSTTEIFWASGACLFIRAELFHQYGGFDDDFFAHMEEIDLCWRLKNAGHKIYFSSESLIYHVGGGTLSKSNPKKYYFNFRNGLALMIKNLPAKELWWKFPLRIIIDWVAALKFLVTGEPRLFIVVLKAHANITTKFFRHFRKRKAFQPKKGALNGRYRGLVLFDYHLRGRKKFKDLPISSTNKHSFSSATAS